MARLRPDRPRRDRGRRPGPGGPARPALGRGTASGHRGPARPGIPQLQVPGGTGGRTGRPTRPAPQHGATCSGGVGDRGGGGRPVIPTCGGGVRPDLQRPKVGVGLVGPGTR